MQTASEVDDSRKEVKQVGCCVHGRPCAIASRLSREKEEGTNRDSLLVSPYLLGSGYKSFSEKSEQSVGHHDDISYKQHRKVEREAIDIPKHARNFPGSYLSTSTLTPRSVTRVSENDNMAFLSFPSKERVHAGNRIKRVNLSRAVDTPSIRQMKKLTNSKERHDQYEMMRPSSLASPSMSRVQRRGWTRREQGPVDIPPSVEAYIGVLTAKEAEEYVVKPASFKLYHMMPQIESLNNLLPSLGLYIIYRSGKGHVYHYPIRQRKQHVDYPNTGSTLAMLTNLKVEYGDPMAPWFFTLDALVSYYNVYVHLHEVEGECVADVFPVQ